MYDVRTKFMYIISIVAIYCGLDFDISTADFNAIMQMSISICMYGTFGTFAYNITLQLRTHTHTHETVH